MYVAQHDMLDGLARPGLDGLPEFLAIGEAPAAIRHQNSIPADNEADVGNGVLVLGSCILVNAPPDKYARRDLVEPRLGRATESR